MTDKYEESMAEMDKKIAAIEFEADLLKKTIEDDMKSKDETQALMEKIEEINAPEKRWYHRFFPKKKQQPFVFQIEGRPEFTEQELAERRAFLDGYSAGRVDGDAHKAYRLWKKMRDNEA